MTPFHLVLAAPLKAVLGPRFNTTAFMGANVAIDLPIIVGALTTGDVSHIPAHWHGVAPGIMLGFSLWALIFYSWKGLLALVLGLGSHLALDGLIYPEMDLFGAPLAGRNGWLELLCVALGALGGAVLWRRQPDWWRRVGWLDIARGVWGEIRFGGFLVIPIGLGLGFMLVSAAWLPEWWELVRRNQ